MKKNTLFEYMEAIIIAVFLALIIRTFVVQAFKIPSGSMLPTLQIGDHIFVNKFIYGIKIPFIDKTIINIKTPQRGDVVVFKFPQDEKKDFIKRVVGIGGETIKIKNKQVYIDGKAVDDPHAFFTDINFIPKRDNMDSILVPKGKIFVMGDNRDASFDGRFWGFVDLDKVKGKAMIIYLSWNSGSKNILSKIRWERFAKLIH